MRLMRLIPILLLPLRPHLLTQLLQHRLQQLRNALLILRIAVPDGDLDCVPAERVGYAADLIVESYTIVRIPVPGKGRNEDEDRSRTYNPSSSPQHPATHLQPPTHKSHAKTSPHSP